MSLLVNRLVIAVSVLAVSTAALAFQEQRVGEQPAPAAAVETQQPKPIELATPAPGDMKPTIGTEVRIPGLGKLGNLPKMDFGLELLYGAAEQKQPEGPSRDEDRGDLTIRGSVKHKF